MKSDSKDKIIDFIKKNGKARPAELIHLLNISPVAVQKHLRELSEKGLLKKAGKPPLVYYLLAAVSEPTFRPHLSEESTCYLDAHYSYVTSDGTFISGVDGFSLWLSKTSQVKYAESLAREYSQIHREAETFRMPEGWIEGIQKFQTTFPKNFLDQVYYQDFYSLPKFGRTRLGHELLLAKQAQDKPLIQTMGKKILPTLEKIIQKNKINAIAWTPHSIPRKIPFLKELRRSLNLGLSEVSVVKAFTGDLPVAQKSLSKLEDRIENARNSTFIHSINPTQTRILVIDDAVGSGATLNEIAAKLRNYPFVKFIAGFVLVGSYKGFEVIKEV
ncbi:MAG: winged helix-turn-helix transcriptional regulator [Deltaproteobacteria bacterium]|nr:MAG: winged helix-turn-helix transcriptional regulator [Deltaproteobacteria bacterium]